MMNNHMMIDIETTGITPGCKILTIGARVFNEVDLSVSSYYDRISTYTFDRNFLPDATKNTHHFYDNASTMEWWQKQSVTTLEEAFGGTEGASVILKEFSDYVNSQKPTVFWCKGLNFDFPILEYAFQAFEIKCPWTYNQLFDARTLYKFTGIDIKTFTVGDVHNALDDAVSQANAVYQALHKLKAWDNFK